jgi:hypothetical protein
MYSHCQVTAVLIGDSTAAATRQQLCGHVICPATREQAIMEETFSVRSVPGLYNEDYVILRSEKLIAEAGTVREPRGKGASTIGSHYQATASEV